MTNEYTLIQAMAMITPLFSQSEGINCKEILTSHDKVTVASASWCH